MGLPDHDLAPGLQPVAEQFPLPEIPFLRLLMYPSRASSQAPSSRKSSLPFPTARASHPAPLSSQALASGMEGGVCVRLCVPCLLDHPAPGSTARMAREPGLSHSRGECKPFLPLHPLPLLEGLLSPLCSLTKAQEERIPLSPPPSRPPILSRKRSQ